MISNGPAFAPLPFRNLTPPGLIREPWSWTLYRAFGAIAVTAILVGLAFLREPNHDESQYVASAVLVADGLLPYRDFAFFQTPLQPLLFAPIVAIAREEAWLALRIVNALLGVVALYGTFAAARGAGASRNAAFMGAGLMATCDIFLFSVGTARNDALPLALLTTALVSLVSREAPTPTRAAASGLLLAGAAAVKISYAVPALAVGLWALCDRRQKPWALLTGAAPVIALCMAIFAAAPAEAWFGVIRFPTLAPAEYYSAIGKDWKLELDQKLLDLVKFTLLGPAMLGLGAIIACPQRRSRAALILLAAGLVAAALPTPTWRQYLLPVLPPLFVLLAVRWTERAVSLRLGLWAAALSAVGVAPTLAGVAAAVTTDEEPLAVTAAARAVGAALDGGGYAGPVATLSPQFLPAAGRLPDPRFAAGPFYFRSRGLLSAERECRAVLLARDRLRYQPLPAIVMVGGEAKWSAGSETLDLMLERAAIRRGYDRLAGSFGPFRVYVRTQQPSGQPCVSSSKAKRAPS